MTESTSPRTGEGSAVTDFTLLARHVGHVLASKKWTLATAESCTGGLIGGALTTIAGSSEWYLGGVITYSNESKRALVGVRPETLKRHGAVSQATALEMADGALKRLEADVAVSVTGIAGPGGAVPGKPVGRVWIGVATVTTVYATRHTFQGDRVDVRRSAVRAALLSVIAAASSEAPSGETS